MSKYLDAGKNSYWKHVKTGHLYVIVGSCRIEATMEPAYLYVRVWEDETLDTMPWARPKDEFLDGRFEPATKP